MRLPMISLSPWTKLPPLSSIISCLAWRSGSLMRRNVLNGMPKVSSEDSPSREQSHRANALPCPAFQSEAEKHFAQQPYAYSYPSTERRQADQNSTGN